MNKEKLIQFIDESIANNFENAEWKETKDVFTALDRKIIPFTKYVHNLDNFIFHDILNYGIQITFWPKSVTIHLIEYYFDGVDIEDGISTTKFYILGKHNKYLLLDRNKELLEEIVNNIEEVIQ